MDELQNDLEFMVRDERGNNRMYIDNALIKDYGPILGSNTIAVYVALASHIDRQQKCHPSIERLADLTQLSKPTVIGSLKLLTWLRIIRTTRLGKTCTNRYTLLDKRNWRKDWDVMSNELTSPEVNLFNVSGKAILLQRLNHLTSIVTKSIVTKSIETNAAKSPRVFSLQETLKRWDEGNDTGFQILSFFIERKKLEINSKAALDSVVKRHIKAARELTSFDAKKIVAAMDKCQKDENDGKYKWGLETILKHLTK